MPSLQSLSKIQVRTLVRVAPSKIQQRLRIALTPR